jgi:hypothetical protein
VKRSSGRREFDPAPGPLEEARAAFAEHVCDRRPPRCVEAASQLTGTRTLLIAMLDPTGEEFVIGDHAVTMYDPTLDARGDAPVGNAIASSSLAETVLPLDRRAAVRLTFGAERDWADEEVSADLVQEINLRSYAWAEREIYGASQARVVSVRESARRSRQEVTRFRPRLSGFLIDNEYPTVGGGYRKDRVAHRRPDSERRPREG